MDPRLQVPSIFGYWAITLGFFGGPGTCETSFGLGAPCLCAAVDDENPALTLCYHDS